MMKDCSDCLWMVLLLSLTACSSDGDRYEALQRDLERPPEILGYQGQYQEAGSAVSQTSGEQAREQIDNPAVHLQELEDKTMVITIDEPFARSWSMVAAELRERMFLVKDKDREKRVFYLDYDPDRTGSGGSSFWEGLTGLFSSVGAAEGEYRIMLRQHRSYTIVVAEMLVEDVWDDDYYIDVKKNEKEIITALYEVLRTLPADQTDR